MIGLLSSLVLAWPTAAVTVTTTSVVVAQATTATPTKPVAPAAAPAVAAPSATVKPSSHMQKDISRHRAMAQAHTSAAQCLESGKTEEVCQKELLAACKGLAIGKYCGMKHEH